MRLAIMSYRASYSGGAGRADLDNDHRATATGANRRLCLCYLVRWRFGLDGRYGGGLRSGMEQSPDGCHLGLPMGISQKTVMPDTLKTAGQNVQQEASDELVRIERHALQGAAAGVVLPSKTDASIVENEKAAVGDGDPMRVTAQIGEHLAWPCERALGVNNPFGTAQRREKGREGVGLGKPFQIPCRIVAYRLDGRP